MPKKPKNWKVLPKGTSVEKIAKALEASVKPKKKQVKARAKDTIIGPRRGRKVGRPTKPGKLPETPGFSVPNPEKKELTETFGSVELLHEKVRRTLYLRSCNYELREIAEIISGEYQCDAPAVQTVSDWINKYHKAADDDCKEFTNEKRRQHDLIINNLLKRWLPVAMAEKFQVTRMKTVDGESVPVIDQNAYDEQAKAGAICIKLLERSSKLWNLDLGKDSGNDGNVTEDTIRLYIIGQLQQQAIHGGPIDVDSTVTKGLVLELHAGGGEGDIDSI